MTATNSGGATTAELSLTVVDSTAPVFTFVSADVTADATSASGAVVTYQPATASDNVTASPAIAYSKASGTLFPIGPTVVTVTAEDEAGNRSTSTFAVTVTPFVPLENWRQTWYGTRSNTGNAADNTDPYHTGIPNLLVFAFFGPNQNPATAAISQLPQVQMANGNLFYSFTEPTGVSGITYGADWSTTLQSNGWHPVTDTGVDGQHIFSVPVDSIGKLFMHLKVTSP